MLYTPSVKQTFAKLDYLSRQKHSRHLFDLEQKVRDASKSEQVSLLLLSIRDTDQQVALSQVVVTAYFDKVTEFTNFCFKWNQ